MLIRNGNVWNDCCFDGGLSVRLENGLLSETGTDLTGKPGETVIDLGGDYLLPGFVDVHIHGFRGHDTMGGESAVRHMSRELAKAGVAAFCPTTMSAPDPETAEVLLGVRNVMKDPEPDGARVLGAHMEAPFLSEAHAGAQDPAYFSDPSWDRLTAIAGDLSAVRLMTLAPERTGSESFIRCAAGQGIRISIGHSDADAETVHLAGGWGADRITHTFNAQRPLHHRSPGVPGAALVDDRFFCEMICDGIHLHDDTVRLLIRCKGSARAVAVTDAMEAAGMPDGEYTLGHRKVHVTGGTARLADGTLAGSVLTMKQAFSRLIHSYGADPADACRMCVKTPAESVGEYTAGHLKPGSPAILTRWTRDWRMKSVITSAGESCQSPDGMI